MAYKNEPNDLDDIMQLQATTNGQMKNICVATWKDYRKLSMSVICEKYQLQEWLVYHLVEVITGHRDCDGNVIV